MVELRMAGIWKFSNFSFSVFRVFIPRRSFHSREWISYLLVGFDWVYDVRQRLIVVFQFVCEYYLHSFFFVGLQLNKIVQNGMNWTEKYTHAGLLSDQVNLENKRHKQTTEKETIELKRKQISSLVVRLNLLTVQLSAEHRRLYKCWFDFFWFSICFSAISIDH